MNDIAKLLDAANRAVQRSEPFVAIRKFRRLVRLAPEVAEFHALLGEQLLAQDQHAEALRVLRRALALAQKATESDCPHCQSGLASLHVALATALEGAGDRPGAAGAWKQALELDPSPEYLVRFGYFLEHGSDFDGARQHYVRAMQADRSCAPAWVALAQLDQWERPARAGRLFRRALRHRACMVEALNGLAVLDMDRKDHARAERRLRRALRHREDALTLIYLGYCLEAQGRPDEADVALQRAQRIDPGDPHPLFAWGDVLQGRGRHQEARVAYSEALRLDGGCADAALRLGRLLVEEFGEVAEGRRLIERGLERAPQHAWRDDLRVLLDSAE